MDIKDIQIKFLRIQIAYLSYLLNKRKNMQTANSLEIYRIAKEAFDSRERLTLDPSVPPELGCAQAVSTVLKRAGIDVPDYGFSGTPALYYFLRNSAKFIEVNNPLAGDIAVDVSGTSSKGIPHGHTGCWGLNHVMSNNSDNGFWEANYTFQEWRDYFEKKCGFITHYFRAV